MHFSMVPPAATVLVVDDDSSFRCALRIALVEEGYEVMEASDGEGALELLAHAADGTGTAPDALVLDVLMPGCSGLGILELLRRFGRPPPTVLVTGFRDRSIDVLARRLGAVQVVHKPVELDEILAAVLGAIKGGEPRR